MSGILVGPVSPEPVEFEDDDEEDEEEDEGLDSLSEAFIRGDDIIIVHRVDCNYTTSNGMSRCDCTPCTLIRGAVA